MRNIILWYDWQIFSKRNNKAYCSTLRITCHILSMQALDDDGLLLPLIVTSFDMKRRADEWISISWSLDKQVSKNEVLLSILHDIGSAQHDCSSKSSSNGEYKRRRQTLTKISFCIESCETQRGRFEEFWVTILVSDSTQRYFLLPRSKFLIK